MASIEKLSVDYQDDTLSSDMNGLRQYQKIENENGTISLEDKTVYEKQGTQLGAKELIAIVSKINELIDAINSMPDIALNGEILEIDMD